MQGFAVSSGIELGETDLAIANALQIAPRASWSSLGDVLGLSAVTVARRWKHMSEDGLAWVTATGSPLLWRSLCNAFLDVDCLPVERSRVAYTLARDPRTKSVEELASGRDLHVNVVTRDLPALSRFVLDHVSHLPGVVKVHTQLTTRIYTSGSDWRLDALSRSQQARLGPGTCEGVSVELPALGDPDRVLLLALAPDGRRSVAELAQRTRSSHSATRRRLSRLVRRGAVSLRCEIAQHLTGWPVTAHLWARVPPAARKRVAEGLAKMPEVRLLVTTSGDTNMFASTWLHSVDSTLRLEERITAAFPEFEIVDHAIVLRTVQRQGWILDELGRKLESAPIDPWDAGESEPEPEPCRR